MAQASRFSAVLLGLAFVAMTGCSSSNKPDGDKGNTPPKDMGPQPTEAKADFPPLSVEDFTKEFNADEGAAGKKYKDKSVVIEGVVLEKNGDPDKAGGIRVILEGDKGDKPVVVRCELGMFDAYTVDQFKKIKAGDKVKVNGELMHRDVSRKEGKPAEIELNICKLVK